MLQNKLEMNFSILKKLNEEIRELTVNNRKLEDELREVREELVKTRIERDFYKENLTSDFENQRANNEADNGGEIISILQSQDEWEDQWEDVDSGSDDEEGDSFDDTKFLCQLCLEEQTVINSVAFSCDHKFCKECLTQYTSTKVRDGTVLDIRCPQQDCTTTAEERMVRSLLDDTDLLRYNSLVLRRNVEQFDDVMYCPDCNEPVECDLSVGFGLCESCGSTFCTSCRKAFHGTDDCLEVEQRNQQIRQSEVLIDANFKKCPGCNCNIEKDVGCNHMECAKCHTQFCWECMMVLGDSQADIERHYANCQLFKYDFIQ